MTLEELIEKTRNRVYAEYKHAYSDLATNFIYNKRNATGAMTIKPDGEFIDLAVVAFNNSKVIDYQIRCLKKFFCFPFRYTIFDNSTNEVKSEELKDIAQRHNIGYIKLPRQEFLPKGFGSYSHGIACNYLYNRYIQFGGGKYFGLLDHDIFPVQPFNISDYLEQQFFYGTKHVSYIWPGFFFIRMDYLSGKTVDFRPSFRLRCDTGGRHKNSLFKNIDFNNYILVKDEKRLFDEQNDIFEYGYSYFDCGWIHCWNASNYMGKNKTIEKMERIYQMLEEELAK